MNEMLRPMRNSNREQLFDLMKQGKLFALLDPFFEIPVALLKKQLEFKDTDPVFYEMIAWERVTYEPPHLVQLNEPGLLWLLDTLPTERWGIFVVSSFDFNSLVSHFQKFVIARGPDQNPYFLRFHDAAVIEVLLRTWNEKEVQTFLGPIELLGLPNLDSIDVVLLKNTSVKQMPSPEECLLSLSASQLQSCSDAIDQDLVKIIYWHLRNYHAKSVQYLEKEVLEERITKCITKARRYSLNTIADIAGFVALMFELAPNFDEHPSFARVLLDDRLSAESKMKKLSEVITDREWDEALDLYDRSYWAVQNKKASGDR